MTGFLHERELSRKTFLKGGGALVVGFSLTGTARAANNPHATFASHSGATPGPTDPNQIDSYREINRQHGHPLHRLGRARPGHADCAPHDRRRRAGLVV
jgi:hypothetical protein